MITKMNQINAKMTDAKASTIHDLYNPKLLDTETKTKIEQEFVFIPPKANILTLKKATPQPNPDTANTASVTDDTCDLTTHATHHQSKPQVQPTKLNSPSSQSPQPTKPSTASKFKSVIISKLKSGSSWFYRNVIRKHIIITIIVVIIIVLLLIRFIGTLKHGSFRNKSKRR
ncbi:Hypothetical protein MVR_LOCUS168 [uncultured virus]|nr:Hypothetical protein MVR_LOCUS168 [uncultured virus]